MSFTITQASVYINDSQVVRVYSVGVNVKVVDGTGTEHTIFTASTADKAREQAGQLAARLFGTM